MTDNIPLAAEAVEEDPDAIKRRRAEASSKLRAGILAPQTANHVPAKDKRLKAAGYHVRLLEGPEASTLLEVMEKLRGERGIEASVELWANACVVGVVTEFGDRVFSDGDLPDLIEGRFAPMSRLGIDVLEINNLGAGDDDEGNSRRSGGTRTR